jgi:deazaflavin-dependent oxidoreductase (nitroreductase family)
MGGTRVAALKRNKAVELFWRIHPALLRLTGGRIGARVVGMPVLLLTTTGRKSGQARTRALTYLPKDGAYVVVASYLGEPRHPAWWLNLAAKPEAEVEVGGRKERVRARRATGEERERLWNEVVAVNRDYAEYQARTTRDIPVVVLERQ